MRPRLSLLGRFLLVSTASLLCLMPLWYYLAPYFAAPVFYLAGEAFQALFHWAVGYERQGTVGVLQTSLKIFSSQNGQFRMGRLAPAVDYRSLGYGIVILWALLLASLPRGWAGRLVLGSLAMLPVQALNVFLHWLNDVVNRAGPEVFAQTRLPGWVAELAAFGFHFNLFVFIALAPVMVWLALDRGFIDRARSDLRPPAPSASPASAPPA